MRFEKVLSKNDVGKNGTHQSGFLVPKSIKNFLTFLPPLDPSELNPSIWIDFYDDSGRKWEFRYVYYNNKLHTEKGTRNEYRITCTSAFMKANGASEGVLLVLQRTEDARYTITIVKDAPIKGCYSNKVKLKGWRQVY